MTSLTISKLSKCFSDGTQALKDVSFEVAPGERVVLLGANGSGKSTLMSCAVRLEEATSGSIFIGEVEMTKVRGRRLREARRGVGTVFQQFHLVGSLSVFHNTLHGALGRSRGPRNWFPATAPEGERWRAMECLERVDLGHLADRRADTLSGGQQQRVALARMLMQEPQLVLADEPVASLDPTAGRRVMDLLWEIGRERRMTVVCTLHQLDLALDYAERIIGLKDGRVVMDRPAVEVDRRELEALYDRESARDTVAPEHRR